MERFIGKSAIFDGDAAQSCGQGERRLLLITFALTLVVRLFFIFYQTTYVPPLVRIDSLHYQQIALNLVNGAGFSCGSGELTALASPGQPLYLASVFSLLGYNVTAALMGQALLSAFTAVIVCILFFQLFPRLRRWGFIVGMLIAVHPHLTYYSSVTMSETLFTFLLMALVAMLVAARFQPKVYAIVAFAGILAGCGLMTRANLISFLPVAMLWILIIVPGSRLKRIGLVALFAIALMAVMLPWIIRNYFVYQECIPLTTRGAHSFFTRGLNPFNEQQKLAMRDGMLKDRIRAEQRYLAGEPLLQAFSQFLGFTPRDLAQWYPEPWRSQFERLSEAEASRLYMTLVKEAIVQRPKDMLRLTGMNALRFWDIFGDALPDGRKLNIFWLLLLPFVIGGILLSGTQRAEYLLIYGLILSFFALFIIVGAEGRYRLPLEPLMILFVPACLDRMTRRMSTSVFGSIVISWTGIVCLLRFYGDAIRALFS